MLTAKELYEQTVKYRLLNLKKLVLSRSLEGYDYIDIPDGLELIPEIKKEFAGKGYRIFKTVDGVRMSWRESYGC